MKGVTLFLAPGFEDMEAIATRDVLVRGGVDVRLVSITDEYIVESWPSGKRRCQPPRLRV